MNWQRSKAAHLNSWMTKVDANVLHLVHVELKDANAFISRWHRHHKPVQGHRFSLGVVNEMGLVGVATVGRPVARMTNQRDTVEVTRLCVADGVRNACSFLYAASARAAASLGYKYIQTFILVDESGVSLRAAGWRELATSTGGDWNRPSRGGRRCDQPMQPKRKFGRDL